MKATKRQRKAPSSGPRAVRPAEGERRQQSTTGEPGTKVIRRRERSDEEAIGRPLQLDDTDSERQRPDRDPLDFDRSPRPDERTAL